MKRLFITLICSTLGAVGLMAQTDLQKAMAEAAAAYSEAPKQEEKVQKPQYWTNSIELMLGFNQTGLFKWAAGGYNTVTLNLGFDAKAKYAKDLMSWSNRLQTQYGFLWSEDKENLLQKSNDLMYLESTWAYKTGSKSKWNYTASFDFRSQFSDSYDKYKLDEQTGKWTGTLKSGLFAPAYTNLAFGMEWTPTSWFNVNIAPFTGSYTLCRIEELRKTYGMKLREEGLDPAVGANYRSSLFQLGAQLKFNLALSVNDVFKYETQLVLFTDYLNKPFKENRVNWDNKISWQAARFFKIALNTWLIYDPRVLIDGEQKVQFKEFFSINFTYTISNKKKS